MTLKLYMHPLSSFCHKVLVALYENGTSFESVIVDFSNSDSRAAFFEKSPMGKMPVLQDMESNVTCRKAASSSSISTPIIRVIAASCRKMRTNSSRCGSGIGFSTSTSTSLCNVLLGNVCVPKVLSTRMACPRRMRPSTRPTAFSSNTLQAANGLRARRFRWRIARPSRRSSTGRSFIRSTMTLETPATTSSGWFRGSPSSGSLMRRARIFSIFPTGRRCRHVSCKVDCIIRSRFLKETACFFPSPHLPPSSSVATDCCWCVVSTRHRRICSPSGRPRRAWRDAGGYCPSRVAGGDRDRRPSSTAFRHL